MLLPVSPKYADIFSLALFTNYLTPDGEYIRMSDTTGENSRNIYANTACNMRSVDYM